MASRMVTDLSSRFAWPLHHARRGDAEHRSNWHLDHGEEELVFAETVYGAVLFFPALERHETGKFWSRPTFMLMVVFCATIGMQIVLTFIAGRSLVSAFDQFKASLVYNDDKGLFSDGEGLEHEHLKNETRQLKKYKPEFVLSGDDGANCCGGADCANRGYPCCRPLPVAKAHGNRSLNVATRPGAGEATHQAHTGDDDFNEASVKHQVGAAKGRIEAISLEDAKREALKRSQALCLEEKGLLNCAPPTLSFLEHWDELDADGDGVWTRDEAREDAANLGCRLGVLPEDVFRKACIGLLKDAREPSKLGYPRRAMPKSIEDWVGIPYLYFQWWQGLAAICVNTDVNLCGKLLRNGKLDSLMDPTNKGDRGGVTSLDSAMDYCSRLLTPGGICDAALPGSYVLYRSRITEKCGAASFARGPRVANPFDPLDVQATVQVGYAKHVEYASTNNLRFLAFLGFILFIWYSVLLNELKDIIICIDFLINFPVDTVEESEVADMDADVSDKDGNLEIQSIVEAHWQIILLMLFMRIFVFCYLAYAGAIFLLTNHTFVDLLLNAVALAFVFDLDEMFYCIFISESHKELMTRASPYKFPSSFPQHGWKAWIFQKENWGLVVIPAVCIGITMWNRHLFTIPIMQALQCACFHDGEQCLDGQLFSKTWWQAYWSHTGKAMISVD